MSLREIAISIREIVISHQEIGISLREIGISLRSARAPPTSTCRFGPKYRV